MTYPSHHALLARRLEQASAAPSTCPWCGSERLPLPPTSVPLAEYACGTRLYSSLGWSRSDWDCRRIARRARRRLRWPGWSR